MQRHHAIAKEIWRKPGVLSAEAIGQRHHRARHRHVGDVRFAAFMLLIFFMAFCLTFRGEAAPLRSSNQVGGGVSACAKAGDPQRRDVPQSASSATEHLRADTIFLGVSQPKPPTATLWQAQNDACRIVPGTAVFLPRTLSLAK